MNKRAPPGQRARAAHVPRAVRLDDDHPGRPAGQPARPTAATSAPCTPASPPSAARSWSAAQPIAESVPSNDEYKYQRQYTKGPLYSAVTGYFTLNQGNTGHRGRAQRLPERHRESAVPRPVSTRSSPARTRRAPRSRRTIDPKVQQAAWDALGELQGAVVALEPEDRRDPGHGVEADLRPERPRGARQQAGRSRPTSSSWRDPGDPLINRAIARQASTRRAPPSSSSSRRRPWPTGYTPDSELPEPRPVCSSPQSEHLHHERRGRPLRRRRDASRSPTALRFSLQHPVRRSSAWHWATTRSPSRPRSSDSGIAASSIPMNVTPSVYPPDDSDAQRMLLVVRPGQRPGHARCRWRWSRPRSPTADVLMTPEPDRQHHRARPVGPAGVRADRLTAQPVSPRRSPPP